MGLLRFCVVFLLGLGVALGAYATGTLDYMTHQHYFRFWYQPKRSIVLRVTGDGLSAACKTRYAVDNHSSRHIFVVFQPTPLPPTAAVSYGDDGSYGGYQASYPGEEFRPADDNYPEYDGGTPPPRRGLAGPNPSGAPLAPATDLVSAVPAVAVAPGEQKVVEPFSNFQNVDRRGGVYGGSAPADCGDGRVVKLQVSDCGADDGACVASATSAGGAPPDNQGDE